MHDAVSKQLFDRAVANLGAELCLARGWTVLATAYPVLEVEFSAPTREPIRLRARCDSWDSVPVSLEWLDAEGGALANIPQGPGGQLNNSSHPQTGRPFVCMAGVREYHTHPSHLGDSWDNYRGRPGYDLGGVITQVWRAWQKAKP